MTLPGRPGARPDEVLPFDSFALTIPPSYNRPVHALDVARRVVNASELRV